MQYGEASEAPPRACQFWPSAGTCQTGCKDFHQDPSRVVVASIRQPQCSKDHATLAAVCTVVAIRYANPIRPEIRPLRVAATVGRTRLLRLILGEPAAKVV